MCQAGPSRKRTPRELLGEGPMKDEGEEAGEVGRGPSSQHRSEIFPRPGESLN